MNDAIKEYQEALIENIEASKFEVKAKDRKQKARYRLLKAKELMRDMETDLLEDCWILKKA